MILPSMDLPNCPTDTRAVLAHHYKQVLRYKSDLFICVHNFYVGKPLPVRTDFILTLYYKDATLPQNPMRFGTCTFIKRHHCIMVFPISPVASPVIPVMPLECRMNSMGSSAGGVHIGGVQNYAVYFTVTIRQIATVSALLYVGGKQVVLVFRDVSPEDALSISNVRNYAFRCDIEIQNLRKDVFVAPHIRAEYKIICGLAIKDTASVVVQFPKGSLTILARSCPVS